MVPTRIQYLLKQFQNGQLTGVEVDELFELTAAENKAMLVTELNALILAGSENPELEEKTVTEATFRNIMAMDKPISTPGFKPAAGSLPSGQYFQPAHQAHFLKTAWFQYAAMLLLIAGTATFLYFNNRPQKEITLKKPSIQQDIVPGGNRAILTLADGSTIILDSAAIGNLAIQGNTKILKLDAGKLVYNAGQANGKLLYNIISTPKGGQYQIALPDGSKVWLNAASSIRFPTTFGNDRKVAITGEVYFEVAPDKTKPFQVAASNMTVQVLGTSFNVNAYADEGPAKASLIEGIVKVNGIAIKPGQAFENGIISSTNTVQDVAWKNGRFNFEHVELRAVMRQLERWYNIKVIIPAEVPETYFAGGMKRDLTLEQVLEGLKGLGVHYTMQGRQLLIQP